jgi:hypothetical protein
MCKDRHMVDSRRATTDPLAALLAANRRKPEEQATAVLACALHTSRAFARQVLKRIGVDDEGAIVVATEKRTGSGLDKIDLEIQVNADTGRPLRRVWVEVKIDADFAPEETADGGRTPRAAQLARYSDALKERDQARPGSPPSLLAVLVPSIDESRDRAHLNAVADVVVVFWQDVGDLAAATAREIAGTADWRRTARGSDAALGLANLATLVWFLEGAKRETLDGDRRTYVGISVTDPMTKALSRDYAAAYDALNAIEALSERVRLLFERDGWTADEVDDGDGEDEMLDALRISEQLMSPTPFWWQACGGAATFELAPFDDTTDPRVSEAVVWSGVYFDDADLARTASAAWRERAAQQGQLVLEHADDGKLSYVGASRPLAELIDDSAVAIDQATSVYGWITGILNDLEATPLDV